MNRGKPHGHSYRHTQQGPWREILRSSELDIFFAGVLLLGLYVLIAYIVKEFSAKAGVTLLAMSGANLFVGRAGAITIGFDGGLPRWIVLGATMVNETCLVLMLYPLFVFFYRDLFVFKWLKNLMVRLRKAAIRRRKQIMRYGVPGLFVFVWFPFWMTGPVVGCAIGFLMGLRNWVNLTIVLVGTYVAILGWTLVLEGLHERMQSMGAWAPRTFIIALFLVAVAVEVRYLLTRRKPGRTPDDGPAQDNEEA